MTQLIRLLPITLALIVVDASTATAAPPIKVDRDNAVPICATPGRLTAYLKVRNPALEPRFAGVAHHYVRIGDEMGLRWDYAFFQMIVETGSLSFQRGNGQPGTVNATQNNFAGLGAVSGRVPGESFADIASGVRAHLQHVQLYAGERVASPLAERTRKVQGWGTLAAWHKRLGRPATFDDLAWKWAPDAPSYGGHIERIAQRFYKEFCSAPDPEPVVADVRDRAPAAVVQPAQHVARQATEPVERPQPGLITLAKKALDALPDPQKAQRSALGAGTLPPPASEPQRQQAAALPPQPAEGSADAAVSRLVSGRTVLLDTPIGTTIPIQFDESGTMRGKAGGLASYLGAASDEGRWWVEKAKLCLRWNVWFKGELQCLQFRQSGKVIHWVSDNGRAGTAKIAN